MIRVRLDQQDPLCGKPGRVVPLADRLDDAPGLARAVEDARPGRALRRRPRRSRRALPALSRALGRAETLDFQPDKRENPERRPLGVLC